MKLLFFTSILIIQQIHLIRSEQLNQISVRVNNMKTTWSASETPNYGSFMQMDELDSPKLLKTFPTKTYQSSVPIPESFDARNKWPNCQSIRTIGNQGKCGSCWAYSSVNAMSDRTCIATNGTKQVSLSVEILIDCCYNCFYINGCKGGFEEQAWMFWREHGIPSEQCKPYIQQVNPVEQQCSPTCESSYSKQYKDDLIYGHTVYKLNSIEDVQRDIMENGPLALSYRVYEDFLTYKSGIYYHATGAERGAHVVRVIGWGTENGTPYWLIANTWGPNWGENGLFRIRRGTNECKIENFSNLYVGNFKPTNEDKDNSSESLISNTGVLLFAVVVCVLSNLFSQI